MKKFTPTLWQTMICLSVSLLFGCNDQVDTDETTTEHPVEAISGENDLPQEALEQLDSIERVPVDWDNLLLPNGMTMKEFEQKYGNEGNERKDQSKEESGPQKRKSELIFNMTKEAQRLMKRKDFVKTEDTSDPKKVQPAQPNGLAYGLGLKDYTKRADPSGNCYEWVFGLDCSGFVAQMAKEAGLSGFPDGTSNQGVAENWNTILEKDEKWKDIFMKDFKKIPLDELQNGDIIIWSQHIGMIAGTGSESFLFNSNGGTGKDCVTKDGKLDENCIKIEHEKNRGLYRGPNPIPIRKAVFTKGYWGGNYRILRLVTNITGEWQLKLRCAGEATDALDLTVELKALGTDEPYTVIRKFSGTGVGLDYDGETVINAKLEGEYNQETNKMKAKISTTFSNSSEVREDSFEVLLQQDDTGYFPTTKTIDNGGCDAEARLINKKIEEPDARIQAKPYTGKLFSSR